MKELKTKDVEQWMRKMQTIRAEDENYPSSSEGLTPNQNSLLGLRAAVALDWFEGKISIEDIDNAPPGDALAAGEKVWDIYRECMKPDPNSSPLLANI